VNQISSAAYGVPTYVIEIGLSHIILINQLLDGVCLYEPEDEGFDEGGRVKGS